jgi:hypothetical protein
MNIFDVPSDVLMTLQQFFCVEQSEHGVVILWSWCISSFDG